MNARDDGMIDSEDSEDVDARQLKRFGHVIPKERTYLSVRVKVFAVVITIIILPL